jgi:CubicO group peptidase (beta-lactamase class C family)
MTHDANGWESLVKKGVGERSGHVVPLDRRSFLASGVGAATALLAARHPAIAQTSIDALDAMLMQAMANNNVPGVGYAIIDRERVTARSLGVRRAGSSYPVTADTLFQAASLSKTVAAATALVLVERDKLALDTDVDRYLTNWKLAVPPFAEGRPVTMRRLLAMTGGINVPGYWGYRPGLPLPRLIQILDGTLPANSPPVRIIVPPGTEEIYSGGGYEIAQAVIESVSGEAFARVARDAVIMPGGMIRSGFDQPLPSERATNVAAGHLSDGAVMAGGGNVFPELAAAGLWSTPGDLATFLIALWASRSGTPRALLTPATMKEMLTPVDGFRYGLGGPVRGAGRDLVFMKRGHNLGFHSYMLIFPETGQGAVIMTNSENGEHLIEPFLRLVSERQGWPPWSALAE